MPFTRPRFAPFFVTQMGPVGPSVTYGIRSRIAADARSVNSVGGSQHRSTWQSAEIIPVLIAGAPSRAAGPCTGRGIHEDAERVQTIGIFAPGGRTVITRGIAVVRAHLAKLPP